MRWGSAAVRWVYTVCKHARALTQAGRLWGGFRAAAFGSIIDARGSWNSGSAQTVALRGDCFQRQYCIGYPLSFVLKFKE